MKLLFDNPVLRHVLRTRRRSAAGFYPALVPAFGAVLLFVASECWRRAGVSFHVCVWRWSYRLGYASGPVDGAVLLAAVVFWLHCIVIPFWTLRDPLRQAIRDHAGIQLVGSGLSPATWLTGHMLATLYELCISVLAYAPFFALCYFFGCLALCDLLVLVGGGLVLGVSARMLWLLTLRCPGTGTTACILALLGGLAPLFFISVSWAPLASCSPLPLLRGVTPGAVLVCSSQAGEPFLLLSSLAGRLVHWPTGVTWEAWMLRAHVGLWCLALPGILAGEVRMHLNWSAPGLGSARARGVGTAPSALGSAARLEWSEVMRLFSGNGSSCCRGLWECLHLLAVTLVAGLLAAMWMLHIEATLDGYDRIVWMGATVLVLAAGVGVGLCVDRGVFSQRRVLLYALPHVFVGVLRIAGLVFGIVYAENVVSAGIRVDGSVLPAVFLLLFSVVVVAAWQSVSCQSRVRAQVGCTLCLLVWVGLVAVVIRQGWLPLTGAAGIVSALTFGVAVAGVSMKWRATRGGGP